MALVWHEVGGYGLKADEYRIASVMVTLFDEKPNRSQWRYSLHREYHRLGVFATIDEAKAAAERDAGSHPI